MDDCNRKGLAVEVDRSLPTTRSIRALEQAIKWRGKSAQNTYIRRFTRTTELNGSGTSRPVFALVPHVYNFR